MLPLPASTFSLKSSTMFASHGTSLAHPSAGVLEIKVGGVSSASWIANETARSLLFWAASVATTVKL